MLQSNEALSITPLFTYDNIEDNKLSYKFERIIKVSLVFTGE
jgi:hypothetical protein